MTEAKHTQAETTAHAGAVTATVNGCRMYLASCTCNDLPPDESEANARLIAAAPDLLAAVDAAISFLRGEMGSTPITESLVLQQLTDARAKATGAPV